MLEPNDLKKGVIFKYKDALLEVTDYSHTHKGRGSATVTIKVRDLLTNSVLTFNFKAGEKVEEVVLERRAAEYLYQDQTALHFMDTANFEQISVDKSLLDDKVGFIKEGQGVTLVQYEDRLIDVDLPPKVVLKVKSTEPAVKGDTASGTVFKPATLVTDYQINVPLFVKEGDLIRVNTETGEYVERVS